MCTTERNFSKILAADLNLDLFWTKFSEYLFFSISRLNDINQKKHIKRGFQAPYTVPVELQNCNFNPLSANFIKWSNTLTQFVGNLPTNCLSMFDHFVGLALKGLKSVVK